jgi:Xaa-Pro aminopeptidase
MHDEQRQRAHDLLRRQGIDRALFSDPASVTWLTGYAAPVQCGPSPFVASAPLVWYAGGEFALVVNDDADVGTMSVPVRTFPGYRFAEPLSGRPEVAAALFGTPGSLPPGRVAVELRSLPAWLAHVLDTMRVSLVTIDDLLLPARAIKTAEEIRCLRRAFALADIGQAAARRAVRPGIREIDVWIAIQAAVEGAAGERVPLGNDCVVGYRQDSSGGWPGVLPLRHGDALLADIGVRWAGYWSDSCGTYYSSPPQERYYAAHQIVAEALELAVSLIRPGARAQHIDREVRHFLQSAGYPDYHHHTGHGVGVTSHEAPRIVPYTDEVLAVGMVLMLEPGIYWPGEHGVRLEDGVLVTAQGALRLTSHNKTPTAATTEHDGVTISEQINEEAT